MQYGFEYVNPKVLRKESNHNLRQTKFTIVIYSEKGIKQAGEVYIDVSEIFNTKQKSSVSSSFRNKIRKEFIEMPR